MNDIVNRYFSALAGITQDIRRQESGRINQVARLAATSLKDGGVLHVYDTGHMLSSELIGRAGGLVAWTPLSFALTVNNPNKHRDGQTREAPYDVPEVVRLGIGRSNVRKGDLLFVGSVSGKTPFPVEVALQGKELEAHVVALTSVEHSRVLTSEHPSGHRLFEVADIVLDNHAPPGDALLEIEGFGRRVCPASGLAAACIMWAINAATVAELVTMGIEPSVYRSVNLPDGADDVRATEARYAEMGY